MTAKAPFTFTAVSYITDKTGKSRCREKIVFEQIPSSKGTDRFKTVGRTVYMPESDQAECDRKMMKRAGKILSSCLFEGQPQK